MLRSQPVLCNAWNVLFHRGVGYSGMQSAPSAGIKFIKEPDKS
jgi:hypothetical protein